jgi:hypothetical protein
MSADMTRTLMALFREPEMDIDCLTNDKGESRADTTITERLGGEKGMVDGGERKEGTIGLCLWSFQRGSLRKQKSECSQHVTCIIYLKVSRLSILLLTYTIVSCSSFDRSFYPAARRYQIASRWYSLYRNILRT